MVVGYLPGIKAHTHTITFSAHTHNSVDASTDPTATTDPATSVVTLGYGGHKGLPGMLPGEKHTHAVTVNSHTHNTVTAGSDTTDSVASSASLSSDKSYTGFPGRLPGIKAHTHTVTVQPHSHGGVASGSENTDSATETGSVAGVRK